MKLFMDLDGVLADLESYVVQLFGPPAKPAAWHYSERYSQIPESEIWNKINWAAIEPTREFPDLLTLMAEYDSYLITSPTAIRQPECAFGKTVFVEKYLRQYQRRLLIVPSKCKRLLAASNHILVDDSDRNINEWRQDGGIGILCPQSYNLASDYADQKVEYIRSYLRGRVTLQSQGGC
jgi:hypothetical protein